jgi:hypothetical protein
MNRAYHLIRIPKLFNRNHLASGLLHGFEYNPISSINKCISSRDLRGLAAYLKYNLPLCDNFNYLVVFHGC